MKKLNDLSRYHVADRKSPYFSVGMEKLDRDAFDPDKAYDKVGAIGAAYVRLQSGWAKTEKQKGVYDFSWLDEQVDNLLQRGVKPWLCLCYGNPVYDENAKAFYGAVGCPPIYDETAYTAWLAYCDALVRRYGDKIAYYEIWNEPDNVQCWKRGVNGKEYADFAIRTAKTVKGANPNAKVIVGAISAYKWIFFLSDAFKAGLAEYADAVSYHFYTYDEKQIFRAVKTLRALCNRYNPRLEIIQGETGSQSHSGGSGAMYWIAADERMQAKHLARRLLTDILSGVTFTSVFTCVDMNENLDAKAGEVITKRGYFGLLSADFDSKTGLAVGEYKEKPSYFVLRNLCALIDGKTKPTELPVIVYAPDDPNDANTYDCADNTVLFGGFEKENGASALVYWNATDLTKVRAYESSVSFCIAGRTGEIRLIDPVSGEIFALPEEMIVRTGENVLLSHIPLKDYPLMITFGDFI